MFSNLLDNPYVPRYVKLAEQLGEMIASGQLKPGDRLPSFAEMKAKHGVSQNTLERVHAVLEKQGLIVREQGRGTFVADRAESAAQVQTQTIGITGEGFSFLSHSSYWARLFQGIRKAADAAEMQLLILDHRSSAGWEKADGVLIASWEFAEIRKFIPQGMPCVSALTPQEGVASVTADDYQGGRLATEYLLKHGHRRIAFMHGKDPFLTPLRLGGYLDALKESGITPDEKWRRRLNSPYRNSEEFRVSGQDTMGDWLRNNWRELGCTALICQNDDTAVGAIEALTVAGWRVPQDVSVIGFDGTEICDYFKPHLTAVELPLGKIGEIAVKLLLSHIRNSEAKIESFAIPTRIKAGDTVKALST